MKLKIRRSWIADVEGNVFAATGDPAKREYYRESIMHNNFKEVHKEWLLLKQTGGAETVYLFANFSSSDNPEDGDGYGYWKINADDGAKLLEGIEEVIAG